MVCDGLMPLSSRRWAHLSQLYKTCQLLFCALRLLLLMKYYVGWLSLVNGQKRSEKVICVLLLLVSYDFVLFLSLAPYGADKKGNIWQWNKFW